jgi:glucan phosphoethanolaminetransferase (alkaline phosphatase superfamily)
MLVIVPVHIVSLGAIAFIYSRLLTSRWYIVLKLGSWVLMISLFYLLIFGSMHFWGDIITIKILWTYVKDFRRFLHSMPFSYAEMCFGLVAYVSTCYIMVFVFAKKIGAALIDMSESIISHRKIIISLFILSLLTAPLVMKAKRIVHKAGEPLMVMLFDHMWGVTDNPLFSQRRILAGFHDRELRKRYSTHPATASGKNVILIIVDALRADHLSAYGYKRKTSPFIDGLIDSAKAIKINRCYSTCSSTLCGVTSILLSRSWNDCAVNGFNLIALLHEEGYQTHALISGAHKEWYNMAKFYSDDCDYYDGKDSKNFYFKDDRVLPEGLDRIHSYSDTPAFFYFHLQSTHETGLLQDKYTLYTPYKKSITTQGMNGDAAINEYDNKVLQADDIIRQLFEKLDRKDYLKNSLVVITADHGQGLGEHGVSGHVDWLYDPQVSVPLIIYDDSIGLYRNKVFARHMDIAPTIIDRLGLPKPASWMGLSLMQDSFALYSYHETGKNGLETGQQKYMIVMTLGSTPSKTGGIQPTALYKYIFSKDFQQEELYELLSDPTETHNLATSEKNILQKMRSKANLEMNEMFGNR